MKDESDKTSLKQMIQGMSDAGIDVLQGIVKSANPLSIQIVNDEKLVISGNIAIVPRHLTEHEIEVTPIEWVTEEREGGSGDPSFASHDHDIIQRKKLKIHNQLKEGDKLHILAFGHGKKYFVLDRV